MTTTQPEPFTDPVLADIAARWVAERRDPASALRAAREGLKLFGLLGGFHIALSRFEAAVRAVALASATPSQLDRACGCSARFERHADGCPTAATETR